MSLLDAFERHQFTYDGLTYPVFRAGSGPAVLVIHEIPNLHPGVIAFGQRVIDRVLSFLGDQLQP